MRRIRGRRRLVTAALATALLAAASCAKLTPEEIEEGAGQQFFSVTFRASNDLNSYGGAPSSLSLCLYQLTDRRAFNSLRDSPDGFAALLSCEKFDNSVAGRERIFINPGEVGSMELERRRNIRYLAIAAGYHGADPSASALLIEIPPVSAKRRKRRPPRVGVVLEADRILRDKSVK
jgi:type VI secretion system VasD/TssJ family lipoprotein